MAIRSRASSAIYSRFAGRDVNLRAVVRLFGVDLLCAAEFKALCDSWFARWCWVVVSMLVLRFAARLHVCKVRFDCIWGGAVQTDAAR